VAGIRRSLDLGPVDSGLRHLNRGGRRLLDFRPVRLRGELRPLRIRDSRLARIGDRRVGRAGNLLLHGGIITGYGFDG